MQINDVTHGIIGAAFKVHSSLGPGLLESSYQEVLMYELINEGFNVKKEVELPLVYKDIKLEVGYRIDLLVEDIVVVEIKSVESINNIHIAQILTYLKLGKFDVGLLLNFNVADMKRGIKRLIYKNPHY